MATASSAHSLSRLNTPPSPSQSLVLSSLLSDDYSSSMKRKVGSSPCTWTSVAAENPSRAPCQRSLHAAAVREDSMYIFGGYDGSIRVNDFFEFNFIMGTWSFVLALGTPPSPRDRHVANVYNDSFYVFAGFDGTSRVNDFHEYNFTTRTWTPVLVLNGIPPSPRHSHASVVHGKSLYCFGGYDGAYRNDFHEFNFETSTWSQVVASGRLPRARYRASCVVQGNKMYLFGGHDGSRHLNDVHIFDMTCRFWKSMATEGIPPIPRDSHVAVVHGDSMYTFGGSTGSAMNDFHELHLGSGMWSVVQSNGTLPGQRFCHVGCVLNDSFYIFGGYDGSHRLNDLQEFKFAVEVSLCDIPQSTLIDDLRRFVNQERFSDIVFIVEGLPIYAHKILCMRCDYFKAMLSGEMQESRAKEIELADVRHPIFLAFMEYLYTDQVEISTHSAMELFVAADKFGVERLSKLCESKLLASMCIENSASIFHAADVHNATSLRDKCLEFMLGNFDAVTKTASFEEMGRTNVELVFEILKCR